MAAGHRHALVLVEDLGWRVQLALEPVCPAQRGRPVELVNLPHLIGYLDVAFLAHLLLDQLHRKQRRQVLRPQRLSGPGVERRRQRSGQVRLDVVPGGRDLLLREHHLVRAFLGWHRRSPFIR